MFRLPESYDQWRLASPPRFEDHPGTDPEPEQEPEQTGDGPGTDEWQDDGGEG